MDLPYFCINYTLTLWSVINAIIIQLYNSVCIRPYVSDVPGRRIIRSTKTARLVVPPFKQSTINSYNQTLKVVAAKTWNGLPEDVA